MDSALLVSSSDKGRQMLLELMNGSQPMQLTTAARGREARRLAAEIEYDRRHTADRAR